MLETGALGGAGVTAVAETTLDVTLAAPAELVVGAAGVSLDSEVFFCGLSTETVAGLVSDATNVGAVAAEASVAGRMPVGGPLDAADALAVARAAGAAGAATVCSFFVGAIFTFSAAIGALPEGADELLEVPPVTLAMPSPEFVGLASATALFVAGTAPFPGVPIPGNTVPCCKLPIFGCAAEGLA